ncbi:MAG TPA: ABC transporter permease [Acetobacteraceae bacterium]|nr:ABC transporter permease [Acetobacteraceae bacterium]
MSTVPLDRPPANALVPARAQGGYLRAIRTAIRSRPAGGIAVLFITIQIVCVVGGLLFPDQFRYLIPANIRVTLKAVAPLGIMSLGVGMLMIAGEFDLSVGALYSFCAVFAATLANDHFGGIDNPAAPFIGAALAIVVGILAGLVNGFVTIRFSIPSFITTLGAMLLWKGGVLLYNGASAVSFLPNNPFAVLFAGQFWLLDAGFVWFILLAVVAFFLLHHHRFGNHLYAVGGNQQAAIAIGIKPARVKLVAFAITGGLAAFSGIIAMTRVGSVQPGGGQGMELQAIAACVIGGFALMGGRGSIIGIVLGTALVFTINDILLLLRAPGFYFDMFVGALIVGAVIMNHAIRRRS